MADKKISALTGASTPLAGTEVLPIVQSGATVKVAVSDLTAGRAVGASSLTTTGNVGVGAAASSWDSAFGGVAQVSTPGSGGGALAGSSADNFRMFSNTYYNAGYKRIAAGYAAEYEQASGTHVWYTAGTSTAGSAITFAQVASLATDFTLASGNVVIGTSGKGIDFSATPGTGTSELFADYEEGTWTPTDGSGAGLVFTGVVGRYTKIGQVVTYFGDVTYPVTANGSGSIIAGLPFTSNSALNRTGSVISTTVNAVGSAVPPSTSVVLVFPAGSLTPPTNATLSTARIIFAGSYQV